MMELKKITMKATMMNSDDDDDNPSCRYVPQIAGKICSPPRPAEVPLMTWCDDADVRQCELVMNFHRMT